MVELHCMYKLPRRPMSCFDKANGPVEHLFLPTVPTASLLICHPLLLSYPTSVSLFPSTRPKYSSFMRLSVIPQLCHPNSPEKKNKRKQEKQIFVPVPQKGRHQPTPDRSTILTFPVVRPCVHIDRRDRVLASRNGQKYLPRGKERKPRHRSKRKTPSLSLLVKVQANSSKAD